MDTILSWMKKRRLESSCMYRTQFRRVVSTRIGTRCCWYKFFYWFVAVNGLRRSSLVWNQKCDIWILQNENRYSVGGSLPIVCCGYSSESKTKLQEYWVGSLRHRDRGWRQIPLQVINWQLYDILLFLSYRNNFT